MNYKSGFYFKLSLLATVLSLLVLPFASSLANRPAMKSTLSLLGAAFETNAQDNKEKQKGKGRKLSYMNEPPEAIEIVQFSGHKSENWLDDFELEIKNKSDKPIYYVLALLEVPEMKESDTVREMFQLEFGEPELRDGNNRPKDLEKSPRIEPGETAILKISENQKVAFRETVEKRLREASLQSSEVTRLVLGINLVRFADGTGFHLKRKLGLNKGTGKIQPGNELSRSRASPAAPNTLCTWWNLYTGYPCVDGTTPCAVQGGSETSFPGPLDQYGQGGAFPKSR